MNRDEFYFEIEEQLGVITTHKTGWKKEVNLVDWNGNGPKIDIRDWNPTHEMMSKGLTFSRDEAKKLHEILGAFLCAEGCESQHNEG